MSGKSIDTILQERLKDMEQAYAYDGEFSHDKWEIEEVRDAVERMQIARDMHDLLKRGGVPTWSSIDAVVELLCGPLNRLKRCRKCGGDARITLGTEKTMQCPACEDGYVKGGDQ
jgi:hypothetical protein